MSRSKIAVSGDKERETGKKEKKVIQDDYADDEMVDHEAADLAENDEGYDNEGYDNGENEDEVDMTSITLTFSTLFICFRNLLSFAKEKKYPDLEASIHAAIMAHIKSDIYFPHLVEYRKFFNVHFESKGPCQYKWENLRETLNILSEESSKKSYEELSTHSTKALKKLDESVEINITFDRLYASFRGLCCLATSQHNYLALEYGLYDAILRCLHDKKISITVRCLVGYYDFFIDGRPTNPCQKKFDELRNVLIDRVGQIRDFNEHLALTFSKTLSTSICAKKYFLAQIKNKNKKGEEWLMKHPEVLLELLR